MFELQYSRRRKFLQALGAMGLPIGGGMPAVAQTKTGADYNVLFLMSDEQNPFLSGHAGDPCIRTPAQDALARNGISFRSCYTPNPVCSPARVGIHSGRMGSNVDFENRNYECLGPYFTRKGFKTAWYGKQDWSGMKNRFDDVGADPDDVVDQRFRDAGLAPPPRSQLVRDAMVSYWGVDLNDDTVITEQALAFLDSVGDQRFFMGVAYTDPHFPFYIQQRYYDMYASAPIPEPVVTEAMLNDLSAAMKQDRKKFEVDILTPEQARYGRAIYYGKTTYMDEQLGRVLNKLASLGLHEKTIIVYTSDHGEMMGQHGIWYKNNFFEGAARVPLLVCLPPGWGGPRGVQVDAPVSLIDIYPTLCELCRLKPPESLEGRSLVPLINGNDTGPERVAFSENKRRHVAARMIRTAEYKYCYYDDGFEQLYDMQGADRDVEAMNLAQDAQYRKIKRDLKKRALDGWNRRGLFTGGG